MGEILKGEGHDLCSPFLLVSFSSLPFFASETSHSEQHSAS